MAHFGKKALWYPAVTLVAVIGLPASVYAQGACCQADGSCQFVLSADCDAAGGEYIGDGSACMGDANGDARDDACPCVDPPVTGCGDCNGDGIPDIATVDDPTPCPVIEVCDDCNVNFLPDGCDIARNPELDADGDGVPDACITAVAPGSWTHPGLWNLASGFPDNLAGEPNRAVTIPSGIFVTLDKTVEIDGLRLLPGAVLQVTDPVDGSLFIRPDSAGGVRVNGEIHVQTDHEINVLGGTFMVAGSGRYAADAASLSPVSVRLTARRIILRETLCGMTDQLSLTSNMTAATTRDFVLDGSEAVICPPPGPGSDKAAQGGKTPPILKIVPAQNMSLAQMKSAGAARAELTALEVGSNFQMLRMANVCVGCEARDNAPIANVLLHGDFDNRSQYPSLFDWSLGKLTLSGNAPPHLFEVAGLDLGPSAEGFDTSTPAGADGNRHSNFSMGTIEVQNGAEVRFVSAQLNTSSTGPEALYVGNLVLRPNSTVVLADSNVYYCELLDSGATILETGTGRLLQAPCPNVIPAISPWGVAVMAVLLAVAGIVVRSRRATA